MTIPRCPPQVASRQPHVPMCMESGRLGPTAGLCGPQVGVSVSLLSGMFVLACVRTCFVCVCARALCVCFCSHGHIRAPLRKRVPARVSVPSSSPQPGRAEAGVPVCCPL